MKLRIVGKPGENSVSVPDTPEAFSKDVLIMRATYVADADEAPYLELDVIDRSAAHFDDTPDVVRKKIKCPCPKVTIEATEFFEVVSQDTPFRSELDKRCD